MVFQQFSLIMILATNLNIYFPLCISVFKKNFLSLSLAFFMQCIFYCYICKDIVVQIHPRTMPCQLNIKSQMMLFATRRLLSCVCSVEEQESSTSLTTYKQEIHTQFKRKWVI